MTDTSRSPAIAAPGLLPLRPLAQGTQNSGDAESSVRFTDVLAESKAPVIRREGGSASPEQMFDPNIQDPRDRRKDELRRDYSEEVDRRSATLSE